MVLTPSWIDGVEHGKNKSIMNKQQQKKFHSSQFILNIFCFLDLLSSCTDFEAWIILF